MNEDYKVPFELSDKLNRVLIKLSDEKLSAEDEPQFRRAKAAISIGQLRHSIATEAAGSATLAIDRLQRQALTHRR